MGSISSVLPQNVYLQQILVEVPFAILILLLPGLLLYLSIYAFVRDYRVVSRLLAVPTIILFWLSHVIAPVHCGALRSFLNFTVAVGTMKLLDIHTMFNTFPHWSSPTPKPRPSLYVLVLLTELRYESFAPNPIRLPTPSTNPLSTLSEPIQLLLHILLFITLQWLPQYPPIIAWQIAFAIHIIWTSIQQLVAYRDPRSPPLFGPFYLADGFQGFWTETWHNAFTSPTINLAYKPARNLLLALGAPKPLARVAGVMASFSFMGAFHMYALAPILTAKGMHRVGIFFVANGVCTVVEGAIWRRRSHWARAALAWIVQTVLVSWVVLAIPFAEGLLELDWREICRPREGTAWYG